MALITCPECGSQVSEFATSCPKCGNPLIPEPVPPPQKETEPIHPSQENSLKEPISKEHKKRSPYPASISFFGIIAIALIATLPFHYVPSRSRVFPKDHLTFSYTFITEEDIENLIKRYNEGSFFEKLSLQEDALVKKLFENGIIVHKSNNNDESDYRGREAEEKRIADSIRQADSIAMVIAENQQKNESENNLNNKESTIITSTTKNRIKVLIDNYYFSAKTQDYQTLVSLFSNPVKQYFSLNNITPDEIINDQKKYSQKFTFVSTSVDFSTLSLSSDDQDSGYNATFELVIVVKNLKTGVKTQFLENINMKINQDNKIYYITEKIISKENLGI
jgi:hypothetical protein